MLDDRQTLSPFQSESLTIDPEFQSLIPALSADEYAALETSLLEDGCRDALVVWCHDGAKILIDGHNRYGLCQKHGLPFGTIERPFDGREDVVLWMVHNQLARRNLPVAVKVELALRGEEAIAKKARENQSAAGGDKLTEEGKALLLNSTKALTPVNTRATIAAAVGTSEDTVRKVKNILQHAPESIKEKVRKDEISINRAEEITKALATADPKVVEVVERYDVEDPQTITLISRLHDEGRDTFEEIAASGYVQISDETDAVPITAPSTLLYKTIEKKSDEHRIIGGQSRGIAPVTLATDEVEWYTPAIYLDAARAVLGAIDLDPASNPYANETVKAAQYYTRVDDGLSKEWHGRVWVNPPYGGAQADFTQRLVEEFEAGHVTEAILLVNANSTDTRWFQCCWNYTLCFTDHRINYYSPNNAGKSGSTHGSVFVYLGTRRDAFIEHFRQFGAIVARVG